jgi:hypothetical protein
LEIVYSLSSTTPEKGYPLQVFFTPSNSMSVSMIFPIYNNYDQLNSYRFAEEGG